MKMCVCHLSPHMVCPLMLVIQLCVFPFFLSLAYECPEGEAKVFHLMTIDYLCLPITFSLKQNHTSQEPANIKKKMASKEARKRKKNDSRRASDLVIFLFLPSTRERNSKKKNKEALRALWKITFIRICLLFPSSTFTHCTGAKLFSSIFPYQKNAYVSLVKLSWLMIAIFIMLKIFLPPMLNQFHMSVSIWVVVVWKFENEMKSSRLCFGSVLGKGKKCD